MLLLLTSANKICCCHSRLNRFTKFVNMFCIIIHLNLDYYRRLDVAVEFVSGRCSMLSRIPLLILSRYAVTMGLTHYTNHYNRPPLHCLPRRPRHPLDSTRARGRYCRSPPAIMRVQKVTTESL